LFGLCNSFQPISITITYNHAHSSFVTVRLQGQISVVRSNWMMKSQAVSLSFVWCSGWGNRYVHTHTRTFAFTVFSLIPFLPKHFLHMAINYGYKCIEVKSCLHLKTKSDCDELV
jgi:hypothetical protein